MLRIFSLAGEALATFSAEEVEGKTVKSLKTLVGKQIGVTRFCQKWLAEDQSELHDDVFLPCSDVQLVVLNFVQADAREVEKLVRASYMNRLDQVDELLRKPMNPNVLARRNRRAASALHFAALNGHTEVAKLLLEAGADKDAANNLGITALHSAAESGHIEVVKLLLAAGADKDKADSEERTALHRTIRKIAALLAYDAERDATNSDSTSRTAYVAAPSSELEIVQLLLEAGVDQNVADSSGRTVLHLAAEQGLLEVAKLLLEAGTEKDASDDAKMTALRLAAVHGHLEVVKLLEDACSRRG